MSAYLQRQIQTRMESKNLTIYSLEKRAGLKRSAVRNILQGFSKKPSAEVLQAIAEVLECSLDDLVGPVERSPVHKVSTTRDDSAWNEELYIDAVKMVSSILDENNVSLKLNQVINLANETYKYSLAKGSGHADKDFTKWLVGRSV